MKKTNKIILASSIVAVLLLGIGYAAIQNITLNISGTAAADPSQSNFKVMFSGTPTVSDDTYVTAAITDDTNATINVDGLTKAGDSVLATYTVQNASTDLSADLRVSTTNNNPEYFTLTSELAKTSLTAGEATTLTVTVELTKTPIVDSVSTTIGVQLEAMPVQPGEEGTSEDITGISKTPTEGLEKNEYGFYFGQAYSATIDGAKGTLIFNEDSSGKLYVEGKLIQQFPVGCLVYDLFCIDASNIGIGILTVSPDGRKIIIPENEIDGEMIFELDLSFSYATIPDGAMYFHYDETTQTAEIYDVMPMKSEDGDLYIYGDYIYDYRSNVSGWNVTLFDETCTIILSEIGIQVNNFEATDRNKTTYAPILESINGEEIKGLGETFYNCKFLINAPAIPKGVTSMYYTFFGCTSLTESPEIPDGMSQMHGTFRGCTSLITPPTIPESVTGLGLCETFAECTALTEMSNIPSNVTEMFQTFYGCTSMVNISELPNSVTSLNETFSGCTGLKEAPVIPNSVGDLSSAFKGCTALKTAPVISNNVYALSETFYNCISLTGEVIINANPDYYEGCFSGVDFATQNLTLKGESTMLDELGATGSNYTTNQ
ncbi:MAG: leucine-rich repeat protein [Clostridia bacterium]|nr:leucine-rich repeat protein [Clostridia bacterium]